MKDHLDKISKSSLLNRFEIDSPGLWKNRNIRVFPWIAFILLIVAYTSYRLPRIMITYGGSPSIKDILPLVLVAAIAGIVLYYKYPQLGPMILVVSGLYIPFSLSTGSQTRINATILLLLFMTALWFAKWLVVKRTIKLVSPQTMLPLFCLLFVSVLAFINGQLPWFWGTAKAPITAQVGGLALFVFSGLAFSYFANQISDPIWLQRTTWCFLFAGSICILGEIFPWAGSITSRFVQNGSEGSLFWVWFTSLAFSQAVYNCRLKVIWRVILLILSFGALSFGLIQTRSWSSGWLPALISIVVISFFLVKKKYIPVILVLFAGVFAIGSSQIVNYVMVGDNQYSLLTRLQAWGIIGKIISVSPILGVGPANYYWYTFMFPILGYYVQFNSHNNYIDVLAQVGILGLICLIWFFGSVGLLGWRLRSQVPEGFQIAYIIGGLGGLVGTIVSGMLGDWIIPFVYNIGYNGFRASVLAWIFLGGMAALGAINSQRKS